MGCAQVASRNEQGTVVATLGDQSDIRSEDIPFDNGLLVLEVTGRTGLLTFLIVVLLLITIVLAFVIVPIISAGVVPLAVIKVFVVVIFRERNSVLVTVRTRIGAVGSAVTKADAVDSSRLGLDQLIEIEEVGGPLALNGFFLAGQWNAFPQNDAAYPGQFSFACQIVHL